MTARSNVHHLHEPFSIQGEQQASYDAPLWMDDGEVDKYVDSVSEKVLECRERGRHWFPSIREAGMVFNDVTDDGLLIRTLKCKCCGLVQRLEYWEVVGRGKSTRYVFVTARPDYSLVGADGERYTAPPGGGRIKPRQIRNSLATAALAGQTVTAVRKAAKANATTQKAAS